MGHLHFLLEEMGLDEMGLDEMALNREMYVAHASILNCAEQALMDACGLNKNDF